MHVLDARTGTTSAGGTSPEQQQQQQRQQQICLPAKQGCRFPTAGGKAHRSWEIFAVDWCLLAVGRVCVCVLLYVTLCYSTLVCTEPPCSTT